MKYQINYQYLYQLFFLMHMPCIGMEVSAVPVQKELSFGLIPQAVIWEHIYGGLEILPGYDAVAFLQVLIADKEFKFANSGALKNLREKLKKLKKNISERIFARDSDFITLADSRHLKMWVNAADLSVVSNEGYTPLFFAVSENYISFARILLEKREEAVIDYQNKWGETALMIAIQREYKDLVKILLNAGASTRIKNKNGDTAISIAENISQEMVDLIKQ